MFKDKRSPNLMLARFLQSTIGIIFKINVMRDLWYSIKNFISNLYLYRKILWKDKQYDYDHLLSLEKFKMQLMLDYFKSASHVDHTNDIRWISICIKLINIINGEDSALDYDDQVRSKKERFKLLKYVNIKNSGRYDHYAWYHSKNSETVKFAKDSLRRQKALYLYHKIRYNYIYQWWD